jgi:hypothetical protein
VDKDDLWGDQRDIHKIITYSPLRDPVWRTPATGAGRVSGSRVTIPRSCDTNTKTFAPGSEVCLVFEQMNWGGWTIKEVKFLYPLSEELEDRVRVSALTEKGKILKFVAQYEALIRDEWRPIVRYDTSHGFAYKDIIHYDGDQEKQPLCFPDLNIAFTFAIQDLKISWRWYRIAYTKEMEKWGRIWR